LKQARLDKRAYNPPNLDDLKAIQREKTHTRLLDYNIAECKANPLWPLLVETTKRSPLYRGLVGYVQSEILPNNPQITPKELASDLSISRGEALVILDAIRNE